LEQFFFSAQLADCATYPDSPLARREEKEREEGEAFTPPELRGGRPLLSPSLPPLLRG